MTFDARDTERASRLVPVSRVLLALFVTALALIVLLPARDHAALGAVAAAAQWLAQFGVPFRLVFPVLEFAANVALFLPFGVLVPLAVPLHGRRATAMVALWGLGISAVIEAVQAVIPGRVSDPRDLIANTLGALLGVLCVSLWRVRRRRAE